MFNVVTGFRRAGTSLMMLAIRQAGIPINGFKFTMQFKDKEGNLSFTCIPSKKIRQANPNGYWELGTITTKTGIKKEFMDVGMPGDVIKITADAFYFSEPNMVDKVIVMARNPRSVLTSMKRGGIFKEEEIVPAITKNIRDITRTFSFISEFNKEYIVVRYEDLISNPLKEMTKVCDFLGRGDAKEGAKTVDPSLNRSNLIKGDYGGIKVLERIYEYAVKGEIENIVRLA